MDWIDFPIVDAGRLGGAMRARGHATFAQVAETVRALPYGRTEDAADPMAMLREGRGTCSWKHRVLATLAHECGRLDVSLTLGIYLATASSLRCQRSADAAPPARMAR